jgi:hypothetical protein
LVQGRIARVLPEFLQRNLLALPGCVLAAGRTAFFEALHARLPIGFQRFVPLNSLVSEPISDIALSCGE